MENGTLTQERLAELLREAERAHGEYEQTLGHRDEDWPKWYAAYILAQLQRKTGEAEPGEKTV